MADNSPSGAVGRLDVPVCSIGYRTHLGPALALSDGRVGGSDIDITVTAAEIHVRLGAADEAFAIDLQKLCQSMVDLIETATQRRRQR